MESLGRIFSVKSVLLAALLLVESFLLSKFIFEYTLGNAVFSPSPTFLITVGILILLVYYTFSLTIGIWGRKIQFLLVPVPIAIGIILPIVLINPMYALVLSVATYLLILYDITWASRVMGNLIKFDPGIILRTSTRGILLLFSLVGSLYVIVNPTTIDHELVENHVKTFLVESVGNFIYENTEIKNTIELETEQGIPNLINDRNLISLIGSLRIGELNPFNILDEKVSEVVQTYRQFIPPIFALLIFSTIQVIGFAVGLVYAGTIGALFEIARKTGFFRIEKEEVEREVLRF